MENTNNGQQPEKPVGSGKGKTAAITIGVGVVAVALYVGVVIWNNKRSASVITETPSTEAGQTAGSSDSSAPASAYRDGEYAAVGSYVSPGGQEQIGVILTLTGGVVSKVEVQPKATLPISKQFQGEFAAGYKQFVVGKNIDEISLTKVSGSSLTPKGFNDALEQIKDQAKS